MNEKAGSDTGKSPDERKTGRAAHLRVFEGTNEQRPPSNHQTPSVVAFDRHELMTILNVYGRKVASGEWRDYAIDFGRQRAVFSIFRRTSEVPLYKIEKDPRLARKQGAYAVVGAGGLVLKRGADLGRVLSVLDKTLKVVSG